MFDALEVSLSVLQQLGPVEERVARRSAHLARQMSRAAESCALNLGEGRLRRGGDARRHDEIAAGSASEVTTALRVVAVRGYATADELASVEQLLDRLRAMLYRLTR